MRWLGKERIRLFRGQRGFSLLEALVAVLILGVIGVVFLSGLFTTSKSTDLYEQRVTALSLAQSQMERIKSANYTSSCNYSAFAIVPPPGYEITTSITENVTGKQDVTVVVSNGGHSLLQLKTIKVKQ